MSLAVGGLAGTAARYLLAGGINQAMGAGFPYGTMAVNLSGCFLIGLFDSMAEARFLIGPSGRLLLMVGFCGAYTTFSTLIFETSNLMRDGQMLRASLNFLGSGAAGLILLRLGMVLGKLV